MVTICGPGPFAQELHRMHPDKAALNKGDIVEDNAPQIAIRSQDLHTIASQHHGTCHKRLCSTSCRSRKTGPPPAGSHHYICDHLAYVERRRLYSRCHSQRRHLGGHCQRSRNKRLSLLDAAHLAVPNQFLHMPFIYFQQNGTAT